MIWCVDGCGIADMFAHTAIKLFWSAIGIFVFSFHYAHAHIGGAAAIRFRQVYNHNILCVCILCMLMCQPFQMRGSQEQKERKQKYSPCR